MVRLLRRLPALHEVECLLGRASLVDDRADPADHADRVRGLREAPCHVGAAGAFSRTASFIEVVTFSLDRSSFRTLAPPLTRRTMGTSAPGSIEVRTTPRVTMTASAKGRSGSNVFRGISSLWVGPRKYPWSAASITVWPSDGRMIRASRLWSPHDIVALLEPVGIDAAA